MKRKGVCYGVGRVMMESNWRPNLNSKVVHRELQIIKNDLHCNAVRICSLDIDRLVVASEDALTQGLEVWFLPEMWDRGQDETIQYLIEAAAAAESLRQKWPNGIIFSVGSELTLFMHGIVKGDNVFDRMNDASFLETIRSGKHNERLSAFLVKASKAVREVFNGPLTYFSVPLETVDWTPFDFIGVDLYRDARIKDIYGKLVQKYLIYNKPVIIGEFGCCTYQGAEKLGGSGFMIAFGMMADYFDKSQALPQGIADVIRVVPRIDGHYVRDEGLQAREITEQLAILDQSKVEGAFVYSFVTPNSPFNPDPRFDSDMANYSLVKSYPDKEIFEELSRQAAKQGKELFGIDLPQEILAKFTANVGRHGETYPDMTWEPKESFRAVAKYYAKN